MDMRGRWYRWNKRDTLSELLELDISRFAKAVCLDVECLGGWSWMWSNRRKTAISYTVLPGRGVRLQYTYNTADSLNYVVSVVNTTPNYGGRRWWWLCPACARRCRILYGGKYFVCRKCSGCYYESQQSKALLVRIDNELRSILYKLEAGTANITSPLPNRPKGMHRRTYMQLTKRYNNLQYYRTQAIDIEIYEYGKAMGMNVENLEDMEVDLRWLMENE
ncbi:hypothetical protein BH10CHL1_BH10CHL1_01660 [soil metagenome]